MRAFTGLLLVVLAGSASAVAEPRFRVEDIGSLLGLSTVATALNDEGHVVGYSLIGSPPPHSAPPAHAFLYKDGVMTDLFPDDGGTFSPATAINESDEVVGFRRWEPMSPSQPFSYSEATGVTLLNPFDAHPFAATGAAWGINEAGDIVGAAATPDFQQHAFLISDDVTDLTEGLALPHFASSAVAVNDSRQIVGTLTKPGAFPLLDTTDSFFYQNPNITVLDGLLPIEYVIFEPKGINADGHVAGYAYSSIQPPHAFVYANGAFQDLGTLGGDNSWGYGIEGAGSVVGASTRLDDPAWRAFLWIEDVMHDVNDLVPPDLGIVLTQGVAINDQGQIAAVGYSTLDPQTIRSYLLTPDTTIEDVSELIELIEGMDLPLGIENSLLAKLRNALAALEAWDVAGACDLLGAFIHEVEAQSGKKIPADDAAAAIDAATSLRSQLGCI